MLGLYGTLHPRLILPAARHIYASPLNAASNSPPPPQSHQPKQTRFHASAATTRRFGS